ncbi:MAG: hypothetical protein LBS16_06285, partial [Prevotellaceae bacterium]|nr:hypothetical protein [Prevotellaceae bacterium]
MNNPASDIYFVNVAKTVAIAFVALAHLGLTENLASFINSFRMPFFFFISGYLLKIDNVVFIDFVRKKFRSLLIP